MYCTKNASQITSHKEPRSLIDMSQPSFKKTECQQREDGENFYFSEKLNVCSSEGFEGFENTVCLHPDKVMINSFIHNFVASKMICVLLLNLTSCFLLCQKVCH